MAAEVYVVGPALWLGVNVLPDLLTADVNPRKELHMTLARGSTVAVIPPIFAAQLVNLVTAVALALIVRSLDVDAFDYLLFYFMK